MKPDEWTAQMLAAQQQLRRLQDAGAPARERRDAGLMVGRLKRLMPAGAEADPLGREEAAFDAAVEHLEAAAVALGVTWNEMLAIVAGLGPERESDIVVDFPGGEQET